MISVLMGVKCSVDKMESVKNAVRSILDQTYRDFEFLICDNGSSLEVQTLLNSIAVSDSRLRLIRPANIDTLQKKLNVCLSYAKGEFIARMDDDDFSHQVRFEEQLSFLYLHPEVDFVGCNIMQMDQTGYAGIRTLPTYPTISDFKFVLPYIHPTLMFRREAINSVGGYSETKWQECCEDYDLLMKMYERGYRGVNIQKVLLNYSIVSSQRRRRPYRYRVNEAVTRYRHFRILKKFPAWLPYVIKPLVVGLLPVSALNHLRAIRNDSLKKSDKTSKQR